MFFVVFYDCSSFTKQNIINHVKWQELFQIKIYLTVCCKQNADGLLCFLCTHLLDCSTEITIEQRRRKAELTE